jgi:hypothetical protein
VVGYDYLLAGYKDVLLGYDLTTHREVPIRIRDEATMIGVHGGRLVVAVGGDSSKGVRLCLIDPAAPHSRQLLGTLPKVEDDYATTIGMTVVEDHVLRFSQHGIESFALP